MHLVFKFSPPIMSGIFLTNRDNMMHSSYDAGMQLQGCQQPAEPVNAPPPAGVLGTPYSTCTGVMI